MRRLKLTRRGEGTFVSECVFIECIYLFSTSSSSIKVNFIALPVLCVLLSLCTVNKSKVNIRCK